MNQAFERHFRAKELALLWGLSTDSVIRLFAREQGVLRINNVCAGKRRYTVLSIPESVALRVHERLSDETFQPQLSRGNPLRVIRLRDLNAGVSKQPRNIVKLKAA